MTLLASIFGKRRTASLSQPACAPRDPGNNALFLKYDRESDLLFARFGDPQDADNVTVEPDVVVRLSQRTHQPFGIEVIDCAAKFKKNPDAITQAFARELLAKYGRLALQKLRERDTPVAVGI